MTNPELRTKLTVEAGIVVDEVFGDDPRSRFIEYQPGNGTRYLVLFLRVNAGTSASRSMGLGSDGGWYISFPQGRYRSFVLQPDGFLATYYVADKMGAVSGSADAIVLAELIGHITDRDHEPAFGG